MFTYYLASMSLVPLFSSRALIPTFSTALVARFGSDWKIFTDAAGIQLVGDLPPWLLSDTSLGILGIAALVELLMNKSPDFRQMMQMSDPGLKGLTSFVLCFHLVEGEFRELVALVMEHGPTTGFVWGQSFGYTWSFAIGWIVFWVSRLRNGAYNAVTEMDEDDDVGAQGLMSWLEDGVAFFGSILVFVLPVLALLFAGFAVLSLYLFNLVLKRREEKQKIACPSCHTPNPPCGIHCAGCGMPRQPVLGVGILGIIQKEQVHDLVTHRHNLLARKRCGNCGDRLKEESVAQVCSSCGGQPFENQADLDRYLLGVSGELPKTLGISTALSAIPLFGLIPGIIYYRINLVSSLRCYLPRSVGCMTRWFVRFLNLFLICLQPVPLLGALTLPLMVLTNYWIYKGALSNERGKLPSAVPSYA